MALTLVAVPVAAKLRTIDHMDGANVSPAEVGKRVVLSRGEYEKIKLSFYCRHSHYH